MADIFHYFTINAPINRVFETISTPSGIDTWWAKTSSGNVAIGEVYQLFFEPDYHWTALVSKYIPGEEFELIMKNSDEDWEGSKVGFRLIDQINYTEVQFYHTDWRADNNHFRISNYCWAMYLRILKRYLEFDELVPYADRLNV